MGRGRAPPGDESFVLTQALSIQHVLSRNKYVPIRKDKPKNKEQAKQPEFKTCKSTKGHHRQRGGPDVVA
jgi:hypothetical protein